MMELEKLVEEPQKQEQPSACPPSPPGVITSLDNALLSLHAKLAGVWEQTGLSEDVLTYGLHGIAAAAYGSAAGLLSCGLPESAAPVGIAFAVASAGFAAAEAAKCFLAYAAGNEEQGISLPKEMQERLRRRCDGPLYAAGALTTLVGLAETAVGHAFGNGLMAHIGEIVSVFGAARTLQSAGNYAGAVRNS